VDSLMQLAELIKRRNQISTEITKLIGRPAQIGHLGEYIASRILHVKLELSAVNKGFDGRFLEGPLSGKTVDVKWYAKKEGLIDLRLKDLPDYYLILTGPHSAQPSSRGEDRLWFIDAVYLFEAHALVEKLKLRGVKIGTAASVSRDLWHAAEIYPGQGSQGVLLDANQRAMIALFSSK
jgi:hypothetical protein